MISYKQNYDLEGHKLLHMTYDWNKFIRSVTKQTETCYEIMLHSPHHELEFIGELDELFSIISTKEYFLFRHNYPWINKEYFEKIFQYYRMDILLLIHIMFRKIIKDVMFVVI